MAKEELDGDFEIVESDPQITILIVGRNGTSKSVLVNGLLGHQVVEERHGVVTEEREGAVQDYSYNISGFSVKVWVSNLPDSSVKEHEVIQVLQEKCLNIDLLIYCVKMTETRFTPNNPDELAMEKITRALGKDSWKKAVFILSFANIAAASVLGIPRDTDYTAEDKAAFQSSIKSWKMALQNSLTRKADLSSNECDITVVPAGHYSKPHLPGYEYWMSNLWSECVAKFSSELAKEAIIKMNENRLTQDSVELQHFSKHLHEQPIVMGQQQSGIWSFMYMILHGIQSLYRYFVPRN